MANEPQGTQLSDLKISPTGKGVLRKHGITTAEQAAGETDAWLLERRGFSPKDLAKVRKWQAEAQSAPQVVPNGAKAPPKKAAKARSKGKTAAKPAVAEPWVKTDPKRADRITWIATELMVAKVKRDGKLLKEDAKLAREVAEVLVGSEFALAG